MPIIRELLYLFPNILFFRMITSNSFDRDNSTECTHHVLTLIAVNPSPNFFIIIHTR